MFDKMVSKNKLVDSIEAWRKKVILPIENRHDISLPYNHITQKIRYETKHTEKCFAHGCFFIVGVKSKENFGGFENIFTAEYNIYVRYINTKEIDLSKVAVNIPINDYIIGSLEEVSKNNQYDSYVLDILDDYENLAIEFKGENAMLVHNVGNEFKTSEGSLKYEKSAYQKLAEENMKKNESESIKILEKYKKYLDSYTYENAIPPTPDEVINDFCVKLFFIEQAFESLSSDFLLKVFDQFHIKII